MQFSSILLFCIALVIDVRVDAQCINAVQTPFTRESIQLPAKVTVTVPPGVSKFDVKLVQGTTDDLVVSGTANFPTQTNVILKYKIEETEIQFGFLDVVNAATGNNKNHMSNALLVGSAITSSCAMLTSRIEPRCVATMGMISALASSNLAFAQEACTPVVNVTIVVPRNRQLNSQVSLDSKKKIFQVQRTLANEYNIQVEHLNEPSLKLRVAFDKAALRWGQIIRTPMNKVNTRDCFNQARSVDNLLITTELKKIDGPQKILGQAGPCFADSSNRIRTGIMQFDTDDLAIIDQQGNMEGVILHEMGHVIGIGTMWKTFGVATPTDENVISTTYTGANGISGHQAIGGVGAPPLENTGGAGTAGSHWEEDILGNELMTGFADINMKMSLLTVRSLKDINHVVDESKAESFSIGRRLRRNADEVDTRIPLHSDMTMNFFRGVYNETESVPTNQPTN